MKFIHEQSGFDAFLTELARQQGLPRLQVEKDYWIHAQLEGREGGPLPQTRSLVPGSGGAIIGA